MDIMASRLENEHGKRKIGVRCPTLEEGVKRFVRSANANVSQSSLFTFYSNAFFDPRPIPLLAHKTKRTGNQQIARVPSLVKTSTLQRRLESIHRQ